MGTRGRTRGRLKGERLAAAVGERLAHLRELRGLTLREAARLVGVERAQLCRLECGRWGVTGPGVHTLARVCDGLGGSLSDLFAGFGR